MTHDKNRKPKGWGRVVRNWEGQTFFIPQKNKHQQAVFPVGVYFFLNNLLFTSFATYSFSRSYKVLYDKYRRLQGQIPETVMTNTGGVNDEIRR